MNALLYAAVLASFAVIALLGRGLATADPAATATLRTWALVGGAVIVVCCGFGGAVVEPQYRYQGRLIWLVPFFAALVFLLHRRAAAPVLREAAA